jgi:hypothetical protein
VKRGTPRHPKTTLLARTLGIEQYSAIGILEALWHFTSEYAPQGDIGRFNDAAIAEAVYWRGSPETLVDALLTCRWIDSVEGPERFLVHDWAHHADSAVKHKLSRLSLSFSVVSDFVQKRISPNENGGKGRALYVSSSLSQSTEKPDGEDPTRAREVLPFEIPKEPRLPFSLDEPPFDPDWELRSKPRSGPSEETLIQWFEKQFWPVVWAKIAVGTARKAWLSKVRDEDTKDAVLRAAVAQGPGILARGRQPGATTLHPATWLNQERWKDEELSWRPPMRAPSKEADRDDADRRIMARAAEYDRKAGRTA